MTLSQRRVIRSKILVNQWRVEPFFRHQLGQHLVFTKSIMQSSSAPHRMKWSRSQPRLWYIQLRGGDWEEDVVTL